MSKTKEKEKIYARDYDDATYKKLYDMYAEHDKYNYTLELVEGQTVEGTVVGQNTSHILIDIGYKDYVMIEKKKDELAAVEKLGLTSGQITPVMITKISENPYLIIGSFQELNRQGAFAEILENSDINIFTAKVLDWNPSGFKLDISHDEHKIFAFMPNTLAGINKLSQEQSQMLIGTDLDVMIESYSDERGTFIASRKKYLQTLIPAALESMQIRNEDGTPTLLTGNVTGTTKSSVFVEFNECLTGMIHISNLDPKFGSIETINPGDSINFYVKEVIKEKLFLTQLWRITVWDTIEKDVVINNATVKDIKKFGALIKLDDETIGLINNHELSKSSKVLKAGDKVNVKVTDVLRMERKISLTII